MTQIEMSIGVENLGCKNPSKYQATKFTFISH